MEKENYTKNYIKIYFWKILSLLTGFLSLFIVVPHLSQNKEVFGVYSLCISLTLYLSYADIGFLSAGQKYASEAFIKNNRKSEIEILGFTGAILLLMIIPFSLIMIYLSFNPEVLISDISDTARSISSSILLILGLVLPIQIIIQRLVQSILIIRIKDYISMRIDVFFNLIKIVSVFYFFSKGSYRIVDYYLFITLITIISSIIILFKIKKEEDYDFKLLFKSIKLNRKEFEITKKLAFSSLFLTVGWVIYYELDLIIIGKLFGAEEIAIYAIGFAFLNFLRNLWNIVFSPFSQRFNHFVGLNNDIEIMKIIRSIINFTFPLCIVVTFVLFISSEKIIHYWVGNEYSDSIVILQVLIIGTCFGFVTNPSSYYITAKTKYNYINFLALSLPISFVLGVLFLLPSFNTLAVAISKSMTMLIAFVIYYIAIKKVYNPIISIKKWGLYLLTICVIIGFLLQYLLNTFFISQAKSSINLFLLFALMITIIVVAYLLLILSKKEDRKEISDLIVLLKK
jgi:O-antigen/teichoic acid export membrane protein